MADSENNEGGNKGFGFSGITAGVVAGAAAASAAAHLNQKQATATLADKALTANGTMLNNSELSAEAREAAQKAVASAEKAGEALAKGAWKSPRIVFSNSSTKAKVAMGAVTLAAALGAAFTVKGMRNSGSKSDSYAEQVTQERAAAQAAQAAGSARA